MKNIIYIISFLFFFTGLSTQEVSGQGIFNDTIFFQIHKTRATAGGFKYLIEFQTEASSKNDFTGTMVLSLCSCYCDSIWDAWPSPSDDLIPGGTATLSHSFSSSGASPGPLGNDGPNRSRGRLNIWQMPGSYTLSSAFTLPVTFTID